MGSSAARDVGRPESSSSTRRTEPGGRIKRRPEVGIPDGGPLDGRIRACAESTSDFGVEEMLAPSTLLRSRLVLVGFETREQLVGRPTGRSDIDRLTCSRASAQRLKQTSPKGVRTDQSGLQQSPNGAEIHSMDTRVGNSGVPVCAPQHEQRANAGAVTVCRRIPRPPSSSPIGTSMWGTRRRSRTGTRHYHPRPRSPRH